MLETQTRAISGDEASRGLISGSVFLNIQEKRIQFYIDLSSFELGAHRRLVSQLFQISELADFEPRLDGHYTIAQTLSGPISPDAADARFEFSFGINGDAFEDFQAFHSNMISYAGSGAAIPMGVSPHFDLSELPAENAATSSTDISLPLIELANASRGESAPQDEESAASETPETAESDAPAQSADAVSPPQAMTMTGGGPEDTEGNNAFLMAMGENSRIEFHAADASKDSWTHLDGSVKAGATEIQVADVTGWEAGDWIAISSTSVDWQEAEKVQIRSIDEKTKTITLQTALKHDHYGKQETKTAYNDDGTIKNQWVIDERAQVGLLSRNIKITGDDDAHEDLYGGHMMAMFDAELHLSGVELTKMGQEGILGRYPVHWHLIGEEGSGQYVKNSSIHDTYNKGIVIHGTSQTQIIDNVIYDTIGHGYFLEDGAEYGNLFQDNLGFSQKFAPADGTGIKSDKNSVSTFWIANPGNDYIGNVAAGSAKAGYWYAIGDIFAAPSRGAGITEGMSKPHETIQGMFKGNMAHSNNAGIMRTPPVDPGMKSDAALRAKQNQIRSEDPWLFEEYQSFHNIEWSVRISNKTIDATFENSVFGASQLGLEFVTARVDVLNSLGFGETDNIINIGPNANDKGVENFGGALNVFQFYEGKAGFHDIHITDMDGDSLAKKWPGVDNNKFNFFASLAGAGAFHTVSGFTFEEGSGYDDDIYFSGATKTLRQSRVIHDLDGSINPYGKAYITPSARSDGTTTSPWVNDEGEIVDMMHHPYAKAFITTNAKVLNFHIGNGNRPKDDKVQGPFGKHRYNTIEDYYLTREEQAAKAKETGIAPWVKDADNRTVVGWIGDGYDYFHEIIWAHMHKPPHEMDGRSKAFSPWLEVQNLYEDEYVFFGFRTHVDKAKNHIDKHTTLKNAVTKETAVRVKTLDDLKRADRDAFYWDEGKKTLMTKIFGAPAQEGGAYRKSVIFGYDEKPKKFYKVPDHLEYKPQKYTQEQLDAMWLEREDQEQIAMKDRRTHDAENKENPSDTVKVDTTSGQAVEARWSDLDTWGGKKITKNSIVVIQAGDRVLFDVDTTIKGLIIDGGELIVEDVRDLKLYTDWAVVLNGGLFQAGTEARPHKHDFHLQLEGDDKSFVPNFAALKKSPHAVYADYDIVTYADESINNLSKPIMVDVLKNDRSKIEGNKLTLVKVSDAKYGTATIENGKVKYVPFKKYAESKGVVEETLTYTVRDGKNTKTESVKITVVADDVAITKEIADQRTDNTQPILIDLDDHFYAINSKNLAFSFIGKNEGALKILNGNVLRYTPKEGYVGTETVQIKIEDRAKKSAVTLDFDVKVDPDPLGPEKIAEIAVQKIYRDGYFQIDLDDYFVDGNDTPITYKILSKGLKDADVSIMEGNVLRFSSENGFYGSQTIQLEASDTNPKNAVKFQVKVEVAKPNPLMSKEMNELPTSVGFNFHDDMIYGMGGALDVDTGKGFDKVYGTMYDDRIFLGTGDDFARGSDGRDLIHGEEGNDFLYGDDQGDRLFGGAGDDKLYGGNGSDYLWGGAGDDILKGDIGRDTLYADGGEDSLTGGSGADRFVFTDDTISGKVVITDFESGVDTLDLAALNIKKISQSVSTISNGLRVKDDDLTIDILGAKASDIKGFILNFDDVA